MHPRHDVQALVALHADHEAVPGGLEGHAEGGTSLKELGLQADVAKVLPLSDDAVTLAETMAARGYDTGAICANSAYLARTFNLDQGFQTYVDAVGSRSASAAFTGA